MTVMPGPDTFWCVECKKYFHMPEGSRLSSGYWNCNSCYKAKYLTAATSGNLSGGTPGEDIRKYLDDAFKSGTLSAEQLADLKNTIMAKNRKNNPLTLLPGDEGYNVSLTGEDPPIIGHQTFQRILVAILRNLPGMRITISAYDLTEVQGEQWVVSHDPQSQTYTIKLEDAGELPV